MKNGCILYSRGHLEKQTLEDDEKLPFTSHYHRLLFCSVLAWTVEYVTKTLGPTQSKQRVFE